MDSPEFEPTGHIIFAIPGACCIALRNMGATVVAAPPRAADWGMTRKAKPAVRADKRLLRRNAIGSLAEQLPGQWTPRDLQQYRQRYI